MLDAKAVAGGWQFFRRPPVLVGDQDEIKGVNQSWILQMLQAHCDKPGGRPDFWDYRV